MSDGPEHPPAAVPSVERAKMLRAEIGKVRCWITGFHAGRNSTVGIPGEDSLRQVQQFLEDFIRHD